MTDSKVNKLCVRLGEIMVAKNPAMLDRLAQDIVDTKKEEIVGEVLEQRRLHAGAQYRTGMNLGDLEDAAGIKRTVEPEVSDLAQMVEEKATDPDPKATAADPSASKSKATSKAGAS